MTSELLVYNYGMSTIAELITSKFLVYNYCNSKQLAIVVNGKRASISSDL